VSQGRGFRVAVLADQMPPEGNGGVASAHHNLAQAFESGAWTVGRFSFGDPRSDPPPEGVVRRRLARVLLLGLGRSWRLALEARRLALGQERFDSAWEFPTALAGAFNGWRLLPELKRFRPDLLVAPDRGAVAAFWPAGLKKKTLVVAHSDPLRFLGQPLIGRYSEADARSAVALEKWVTGSCLGVVCPSRYMREVFARDYAYAGPLEVIPNLLEQGLASEVKPRFFAPGQRRAGALSVYLPGAGNPNKGRRFIAEIVTRLARSRRGPTYFFLSGAVDLELSASLAQTGPKAHVFAPGQVPYALNLAYLKSCDLCVSPTLIENFSMALLEAQTCGLPVVTFDVGGNRELVAQGETGALVRYLDLGALVEAAGRLMGSGSLRRSWGEAARRRARKFYSREVVLGKYRSFFRRLGLSALL
jgi:glycosyltransferase involved in cell wall biosynthesis